MEIGNKMGSQSTLNGLNSTLPSFSGNVNRNSVRMDSRLQENMTGLDYSSRRINGNSKILHQVGHRNSSIFGEQSTRNYEN